MITAFSLLAGMFMLKQATAEIDEHGLGQGWTMYITAAILSRERFSFSCSTSSPLSSGVQVLEDLWSAS